MPKYIGSEKLKATASEHAKRIQALIEKYKSIIANHEKAIEYAEKLIADTIGACDHEYREFIPGLAPESYIHYRCLACGIREIIPRKDNGTG